MSVSSQYSPKVSKLNSCHNQSGMRAICSHARPPLLPWFSWISREPHLLSWEVQPKCSDWNDQRGIRNTFFSLTDVSVIGPLRSQCTSYHNVFAQNSGICGNNILCCFQSAQPLQSSSTVRCEGCLKPFLCRRGSAIQNWRWRKRACHYEYASFSSTTSLSALQGLNSLCRFSFACMIPVWAPWDCSQGNLEFRFQWRSCSHSRLVARPRWCCSASWGWSRRSTTCDGHRWDIET